MNTHFRHPIDGLRVLTPLSHILISRRTFVLALLIAGAAGATLTAWGIALFIL